jgi:hypothetical protein
MLSNEANTSGPKPLGREGLRPNRNSDKLESKSSSSLSQPEMVERRAEGLHSLPCALLFQHTERGRHNEAQDPRQLGQGPSDGRQDSPGDRAQDPQGREVSWVFGLTAGTLLTLYVWGRLMQRYEL